MQHRSIFKARLPEFSIMVTMATKDAQQQKSKHATSDSFILSRTKMKGLPTVR